ncbi:hypothetical protein RND71_008264 [Anisodus tanguticus]|uniref:X8 domain-containing protein n=1 Tax=Anisodus tanguticus TaxID=243964 RepID=A0AAE1VU54_9SOLA|nr:hypothetical protein RND71_008264 [Anisodus tanguticus]
MDSRNSNMKFYILALHTFQLLALSSFGLSDHRARITPTLGRYKSLRLLLQVESTSQENSFPYGIYTSPPPPPPLLVGAVPPISPQINSPPFGISTPPTPSKSVPPSPHNSSPYGTLTPPPTPTSSGAMPPPLLSASPPPPPSPSAQPPPSSPSAQTPNAPKPPAINQPPPNSSYSSSPPPPTPPKKPENAMWCVAKPTVPADLIQQALDYACGSGAGCDAIQPNGACYQPVTLLSHASYAFNSYWQKREHGGGTCDFGGTAMLVTVDPSYDQCHFTYN